MRFIQSLSNTKKILFFLVLPALAIFAGSMFVITLSHLHVEDKTLDLPDTFDEQPPVVSPAETVMTALSAAYPEWISHAEFREPPGDLPPYVEGQGDWAFQIRGRWFYYAEGRILPEELRAQASEYRAMGFNRNYPPELSSWESTVEQRAARTRNMEENRGSRQSATQPTRRNDGISQRFFFEALWNISNRDDAVKQMAEMEFLGQTVKVHSGISNVLRLVEGVILNESKTSPSVRQWIDSLGTVQGWNWRNVANSGSRSFHSYGIAIDILPKNLGGLETYWLWASRNNPQWRDIPYSRRYHPPDEVIKAFESFGFIWGGKWPNFDTMHFEYHPEVFIFSNIPILDFRTGLP